MNSSRRASRTVWSRATLCWNSTLPSPHLPFRRELFRISRRRRCIQSDVMKIPFTLVTLLTAALSASLRWPADPEFESSWHDGKAELDGYKFTISRYRHERKGQGVLVYVTEPFSESKRVKVDNPNRNP